MGIATYVRNHRKACGCDDCMCMRVDEKDALRETVRGNLTGENLRDAISDDVALRNKLEALLSLVAAGANDDCDHGRMLREVVEAACELAIDAKASQ